MYWNDTPQSNIDDINRININMRCIEMGIGGVPFNDGLPD